MALLGLAERTVELYTHYLELFASKHGDDALDKITYTHIVEFSLWAQSLAVTRSTSVNGASAAEHAISAARRLLDTGVRNGFIGMNVAKSVNKPARQESRRRPLDEAHIAQMYMVVTDEETGILRFLQETACRREGMLNLTPQRVNRKNQTVLLHEKGSKVREQPVSSMMIDWLTEPGCPIYKWTPRKNDGLWSRIQRDLDWAAEMGVTTHWMRHTTLSKVERVTRSMGLTAAFAGHKLSGIGATPTYAGRYGVKEVCWAFSVTFGVPHPLVPDGYVPIGIDYWEPQSTNAA
ncbi:hypothetical protein AB0J83_03210 [Actinoplanes sp. NPDC049596]|uniref:tyrosine-type recombinase/integrase n=1 Tax=unclassified Actinoplanes TaxID=2626549 RepID=UPI003433E2D9